MKRLVCLVIAAFALCPCRSAHSQIPLFSPPDRVSVYGETAAIVGASDLESDGPWPSGMPGVGVELGYGYGALKRGFAARSDFALGIGYEYQAGFRSHVSTFDFRGAVQGLPLVSLYVSPRTSEKTHPSVFPYAGVRTGYVTLLQGVAFDNALGYHKVDGGTYQLGLALGLQHSSGWFLELSAEARRFRSLRYEPAPKAGDGLPKEINASQVSLAVGFEIFKPTEKKPATKEKE